MKAFKNSVNFGFWRGTQLEDPAGLLQGDGDKMRHIKLVEGFDLKAQADAVSALIKQALSLNSEHGDPTKKK